MFWLIPLLVIAGVTIPLVVADIGSLRLPNALVLACYASFAVAAALASSTSVPSAPPSPALTCLLVLAGAGALWVTGALGMGDVKLMGVLAGTLQLLPNSHAPPLPLVAAGATVLLVAPAAVLAMLSGRRVLPLGPFLLAGFWLAAGFGLAVVV